MGAAATRSLSGRHCETATTPGSTSEPVEETPGIVLAAERRLVGHPLVVALNRLALPVGVEVVLGRETTR